MKVAELRPSLKNVDMPIKILKKGAPRDVMAGKDYSMHKVSEVLAADETGSILLTLWGGLIDKVEQGKTYRLTNAYTSIFRNSLRLNLGKYGKIEPANEELNGAKSTPNISEKEFDFSMPSKKSNEAKARE